MLTDINQFRDKVIMITGGVSGIGLATCELFLSFQAKVAIVDIGSTTGLQIEQRLNRAGNQAKFFECDVTDEIKVDKTVTAIEKYFDGLNFAYNNAGIGGGFGLVENYPTLDWDQVMNVNLKGVFLCMKYQLPAIARTGGGAIVNCASVLSTVCYESDSAYVASKFGVLGLTKNAALDYAKSGIRINAVSPGFTYSPMILKGDTQKIVAIESKHPAGRLSRPIEIARGVAWLCSNECSEMDII